MKSIGIFCGSSEGHSPVYMQAARETGTFLAQAGLGIVYGGGRVGLMGAVADSALQHGGYVTGVMPVSLVEREIAHTGLTDLQVVENMHQRKDRMAALSSAFIALPGGAGTLEEIFEQWTWAQLGIHNKPCAFYNVNDFYQPLQAMVQKMADEGFMKQSYVDMLLFSDSLPEIVAHFATYTPPASKWTASQK
ncbi:TPA: TIGR00730 family Rossman fold protein [Citrobacter farmeri]